MSNILSITIVAMMAATFAASPVLAQDQGISEGTPLADLRAEMLMSEAPSVFDAIRVEADALATLEKFNAAQSLLDEADKGFDQDTYAEAERRVTLYTEATQLGDDVATQLAAAEAEIIAMAGEKSEFDKATIARDTARSLYYDAVGIRRGVQAAEAEWQQAIVDRLAANDATIAELAANVEAVEPLADLAITLCGRLNEERYAADCAAVIGD